MADWNEFSEMLQKGKAKEVADLCQKALDEGSSAKEILNEGLMLGMGIVGERFKKNEVYVPEVLIAARAMNAGIDVLKPHMTAGPGDKRGKVILGTVKGDLHDIGKNLVKIMMEGKGLEVVDLGADVPTEKFVTAAKEEGARIIACSALLTTTMTEMENVVKAVKEAGMRDSVIIMVGGAPVTQNFCESIGADIYSADATSAAEAAIAACAS
ncbi:corrinoid protein [Marispirochaeta sp.]|jgi:corrinoid protein of di/trimethylamine methyltransferase|uniref:corrinoid protein n=1 Tax=Marispirochaeta sp. TaxID=2038653 RepID=UPI0029C8272A|nr:corrinoid protein [Marispirochaeta sp.]